MNNSINNSKEEIFEEIIPVKKKKEKKEKKNNTIKKCSTITDLKKCQKRSDCLLNKSNKCQKKPVKNNKLIEIQDVIEIKDIQDIEDVINVVDVKPNSIKSISKSISKSKSLLSPPSVKRVSTSACDEIQLLKETALIACKIE